MLGLALVLGLCVVRSDTLLTFGSPCLAGRARVPRASYAFGLLTGLSICPPFLLAIATALGAGGAVEGALFFAAFFVGTTAYLAPLAAVGLLGRWQSPRLIGRMAGGLSAALFGILGLARLVG